MKVLPALLLLAAAHSFAADAPAAAGFGDAPHLAAPEHAALMAATPVGTGWVAVGDYGVVLLSADGHGVQQAGRVPTRSPLTGVCFVDAQQGWAVGHDGTILATRDGGRTWQVQRQAPGKEQVLLSVWFENARHGWAVGQFGLALETHDGGATWAERHLSDDPDLADKHLMQLFGGPEHALYVAAEGGTVFRSDDAGAHWQAVQTGNKGSFWTGSATPDGGLLLAGLRGHVWRSEDRGAHWHEVDSGTQQSLTAAAWLPDGRLRLVGLGGVWLDSTDQGRHLSAHTRADRANLTGLAGPTWFSLAGLLAEPR